jgi:hypothetical protein
MTEPLNNIDTELGEILDLFEKRLDTVRHVPCKHEIKSIKCDKLGCVSLDEWRKGTKANHDIVVKTAKRQIQALLNKSVLEARKETIDYFYWRIDCSTLISELEGWRGCVENAKDQTERHFAQLRQITEQEDK